MNAPLLPPPFPHVAPASSRGVLLPPTPRCAPSARACARLSTSAWDVAIRTAPCLWASMPGPSTGALFTPRVPLRCHVAHARTSPRCAAATTVHEAVAVQRAITADALDIAAMHDEQELASAWAIVTGDAA